MSGRYFHGLHLRLNNLYSDYCQDCNLPLWRGNEGEDFVNQDFNLALNSNSTVFKALIKAVNDAYQKLHSKGNYNAQDIQEYSQLIDATNDVFQNALKKGVGDNVIPAKMKQALDEDIFVFSALKTHAQLFEASRLLQTEDGKVKSFNAFSNDVAKIKADYNQSYLEAEYQFAQSSAQQAANWADIEENKGRYNLQYRTANDDRVRDSHALLNGVTLPAEDAFWNEYYPPNGWRCRCVAVEVLKDKYATDDSVAAIEKGQKATSQIGKDGKNRLEIFRFNPGKQKVIFPPNHPYQPKGCGGDVASLKGAPAFFLSADNGKCKAKSEAKKLYLDSKFTTKKIGKGTLTIHKDLDPTKDDYKSVNEIGEHFAKQGKEVVLPPKFDAPLKSEEYKQIYKELENTPYWGKCPDLKVGNVWYEHEGFVGEADNKYSNMLGRGLKQAAKVIIEKTNETDKHLKKLIKFRIYEGQKVDEIWVKNGKKLTLFYKNPAPQ